MKYLAVIGGELTAPTSAATSPPPVTAATSPPESNVATSPPESNKESRT